MTKRKRNGKAPTGLVWRDGRAYFDRRHQRFDGGRLAISLRTSDADVAYERHGALVTLMQRGDWSVLEAVRAGDMHISDVQAALRDGDQKKLRRHGKGAPRLGDAVARFMRRKEATKAPRTVAQYRSRLKGFTEAFGAGLPMDELTRAQAEAYLHAPKPTKPWAPKTMEAARVVMGALWNMVMEEEAEALVQRNVAPSVRTNPWTKLDLPEIRQTRTSFLTPEEWRALDKAMIGQPARALVALAFLAGLRQGEIIHLRPGIDVVLDGEPLIRVQARKGEHPWRPKTRRGERDVPITAALVEILEDHIARGYAGARYLITTPGRDRPISTATAQRWVQLAFEAAGIKYGREGDALTHHSGRHSFASWLAQEGVPLNIVAVLLGDTMKVVEEVYSHLVPDTYRTAVAHIERRARGDDNETPSTTVLPSPGAEHGAE